MTPDAELLDAFAATRADAAFAELVRRYGPLVEGTCRRVLAGHADADDAYQATFLILVRRAHEVRDPHRLGAWLHGVAVRCAKRARERALARRETPLAVELPARPEGDDCSDARALLDVELARLPAHYRAALVLCELQGVGRAEAARRLGVPEGTVSSRLARGKARLRARLVTRGVTLTSAAVAGLLGEASAVGAAKPVASPPSAAAVAIFQLEVPAMTGSLIGKLALALITALGLSAAGLWLAAPPEAKPDAPLPVDPAEVADLKAMQGEWRVLSYTQDGQLADRQLRKGSVTIKGDELFFGGDRPGARFVIYPNELPKQIDIVFPSLGGANKFGLKREGIYKLDAGTMTLSIACEVDVGDPRVARPTTFDSRAGGMRQVGSSGAILEYVLCRYNTDGGVAQRKPIDPSVEKKAIQGRWKLVSMSGGVKGVPTPDGTDVMELTEDAISGFKVPSHAKGPAWRYVIYPNEGPPQIDAIEFIDGQTAGTKREGVYLLDGDSLTIHWNVPGVDKNIKSRPTNFTPIALDSKSERQTPVLTFERVKDAKPRE